MASNWPPWFFVLSLLCAIECCGAVVAYTVQDGIFGGAENAGSCASFRVDFGVLEPKVKVSTEAGAANFFPSENAVSGEEEKSWRRFLAAAVLGVAKIPESSSVMSGFAGEEKLHVSGFAGEKELHVSGFAREEELDISDFAGEEELDMSGSFLAVPPSVPCAV